MCYVPSRPRAERYEQLEFHSGYSENDCQIQRPQVRLFVETAEVSHVETHIQSAHAALSPWEGQNALDAAVLAYNNIAALRQQLRPHVRVHGTFKGEAWTPNGKEQPTLSLPPFHLPGQ